MSFFSSACHTLFYLTKGDRTHPPLLLLHGFLGSHQDFAPLLPTLSRTFYCIIPDLPGHGKTQTQSGGYTFAKTADALRCLLNHLGIRQTHLLGYSMGGRLALYLLCKLPSYFERAVLESASPGLKTREERQERMKKDDAIAHTLQTTSLPTFLAQWYQNPLFSSLQIHPQRYAEMLQQRQQNCPHELSNALQGYSTGRQPSFWSVLHTIDTPTLLIVGAFDSKFLNINSEMSAQLANAALTTINDCGHNTHLEAPIVFARAVTKFLCA